MQLIHPRYLRRPPWVMKSLRFLWLRMSNWGSHGRTCTFGGTCHCQYHYQYKYKYQYLRQYHYQYHHRWLRMPWKNIDIKNQYKCQCQSTPTSIKIWSSPQVIQSPTSKWPGCSAPDDCRNDHYDDFQDDAGDVDYHDYQEDHDYQDDQDDQEDHDYQEDQDDHLENSDEHISPLGSHGAWWECGTIWHQDRSLVMIPVLGCHCVNGMTWELLSSSFWRFSGKGEGSRRCSPPTLSPLLWSKSL